MCPEVFQKTEFRHETFFKSGQNGLTSVLCLWTTRYIVSHIRDVSTSLVWEDIDEPDNMDFQEFAKLMAVKEKKKPLSDTITKSKAKQVSVCD